MIIWKKAEEIMKKIGECNNKQGMEMVQVAILVAIAVAIGLIFKTQITGFVNEVFRALSAESFI